jgi:hypothetical protein
VRKYDEDIGRFTSIDPLWEKYYSWTPYHYCSNNPVMGSDPGGMLVRESDFMFPPGHDKPEYYQRSGEIGLTFGLISSGVLTCGFSLSALAGESVFFAATSVVTVPLATFDIAVNTASLVKDNVSNDSFIEFCAKPIGVDEQTQNHINTILSTSNIIIDVLSRNPLSVINDILGYGLTSAKNYANEKKDTTKETKKEKKDEIKAETDTQKATKMIFKALNLDFSF